MESRSGLLAVAGVVALFSMPAGAGAAITPVSSDSTGALTLGQSITAPGTSVSAASFSTVPPTGTPHATADAAMGAFPTNGSTFALLTAGSPQQNTTDALGGTAVRGDTDRDVSILKLDLNAPSRSNCLTFDYGVFTHEFVDPTLYFNDAFVAELDSSTWTTSATALSAPNAFAAVALTASASTFSGANATGTGYTNGTPLLGAAKQTSAGPHSLYLSIFDQGDTIVDTAAFVDNLKVGYVADPAQNCKAGAKPAVADVEITQSDSPDPALTGQPLTYTATVKNNGPDGATGVVFTDNLPPGVTFVSATSPQGLCNEASGTVTCNLGGVANGETATVQVTVKPQAPVSLTNNASVSANEADTNSSNDTSVQSTTVDPTADLKITKSGAPDLVLAGQTLTYTTTVENNGLDTATGVTVTDPLPAGVTFESVTPSQGSCNESAGTVTCNLGSITNTGSATVEVEVKPQTPGTITNTASVTGTKADPVSGDNSSSVSTTVDPSADLHVTKSDAPGLLLAGEELTYTVTVDNDGLQTATGVTLIDDLPASVVFESANPSQGSCDKSEGPLTCDLGDLADGADATVVITVRPQNPGTITNTAAANAEEGDPDTADNSASEQTTVDPSADLAVSKTDSPDPVLAGQTLTYTAAVTNNGLQSASDVTLTDNLPAGVIFNSATPTQGTCNEASGTVTCDIGTLADGASASVDIAVVPASEGTITNTASADGSVGDPGSTNDSATESTIVDPAGAPTFSVTNTADHTDLFGCTVADCTLREAIDRANTTTGKDTIDFQIAGAPPFTIQPASALPTITERVIVDAGCPTTPNVVIDGSGAGALASGLTVSGTNGTVIRGLAINRYAVSGITLSSSTFAHLDCNFLGTDATGTADQGNGSYGVEVAGGSSNIIGGPARPNVISGNNSSGIRISNTTATVVAGNHIGTDVSGTAAVPNSTGIFLGSGATATEVGASNPGAPCEYPCNLISGNDFAGIDINAETADANLISGNFIGTNGAGAAQLDSSGSVQIGIVANSGDSNVIGGTSSGSKNVISGNHAGVLLTTDATANAVRGNLIGTDVSGSAALGNVVGSGIDLNGATGNVVGGGSAGAANVIANNASNGVHVRGGNGNAIRGNSIHSNAALGIELGPGFNLGNDGVTPNDGPGDPDSGSNNRQNFPVLSAATSGPSTSTIEGDLTSALGTFELDFFTDAACDPSGNGEGRSYLGSTTISISNAGTSKQSFKATLPAVTVGHEITATATDSSGNTSEFSACRAVAPAPPTNGDDFTGTQLDPAVWETAGTRWCMPSNLWRTVATEDCAGVKQSPPYGSITVADGLAKFAAGSTRAFPYVWTKDGVFPSSGDFVLDVRMRYDSIAPHGDGLLARSWADPTPSGSNRPGGEAVDRCSSFQVWADAAAGLRTYLLGIQTSVPGAQRGFHDYRFQYVNGKYMLFVDGQLRIGPVTSSRRADRLWLGNPIFTHYLRTDWTDFSLEHATVSQPSLIDSDGNGQYDGTQSWTPTNVPAAAQVDTDGDGLPNHCDPATSPPIQPGTLRVGKQTSPDGAQDKFAFTGEVSGSIGDNQTLTKQVTPGNYTVTESPVDGWDLSAITCDDADSVEDMSAQMATFKVGAGETVTCTFVNEKIDPATGGDEFGSGQFDPGVWDSSNTARWCQAGDQWRSVATQKCGGFTQNPPFGSIDVAGGLAKFNATAATRAFPYVWSRDGVVPPSGDYVIDVRMRYDAIRPHGDGLSIRPWSDPTPTGTNTPFNSGDNRCGSFGIWADAATGLATGMTGVRTGVPGGSTTFHKYRLQYVNGKYLLFVDGQLRIGPISSSLRANRIWIGNPTFTYWAKADWTDFSVDYVRVTQPAVADTDGNGEYDGTQAWTPVNVPASAQLDTDGDGLPNNCDTATTPPIEPGHIVMAKETEPDGAAGSFSFGGEVTGSIGDGQTLTKQVAAGTYTVTESAATGFDLTTVVCDDGNSKGDTTTRTVTFKVDPGETVTCTSTSSELGQVIVAKDAQPDSDQDFTFTASGGLAPAQSNGRIAFASSRDGDYEIYTDLVGGGDLQKLTNNTAQDMDPSWSPDGQQIAFQTNRDGNNEIYTMNSNGGAVTRLTTNTTPDVYPAWSPNGTTIAFSSFRGGNYDVYSIDTGTTVETNLTNASGDDLHPAWSPDGNKLAFQGSRPAADYNVFTANSDGSDQTAVTSNAFNDISPAWSPDGTKIAFATNRHGFEEIYRVDANGTGETRLTNHSSVDDEPAWSPDGQTILFYSQRTGNFELFSMNASDGSGLQNRSNSAGDDIQPDWQPGSSAFSFALDDDANGTLSNTRTFDNLSPGEGYSVSEAAPAAGWFLQSATCSDGSSPSNIDVGPGETVTCTFKNAQPGFAGQADGGFGTGGKVITDVNGSDEALAVVTQPDGKAIAAGYSNSGAGQEDIALVRYNADGSLDASFGAGGKVITDLGSTDAARSIALQPDGKIVVAGVRCSPADCDFAVLRYQTDGNLDATFGTGGVVTTDRGPNDQLNGVAIQLDGKIVVGGLIYSGAQYDFAVARYETDGSLDSSFGTGGVVTTDFGANARAFGIRLASGGKIVLAGTRAFDTAGTNFALARYNSDGGLDSSFGSGGKVTTDFAGSYEAGRAIDLDTSGSIVVAGSAEIAGNLGFGVALYKPDGSLDPSFGSGGKATMNVNGGAAYAVKFEPNGKIIAAGFGNDGTTTDFALVRFNPDGSGDPLFGTGGKLITNLGNNDYGNGLAIAEDGSFLAVGRTGLDFALVRYLADERVSQTFDSGGGTVATGTDPTATDPVEAAVTSPVAGTVTIADGSTSESAPSHYDFLDWQVDITAPAASVNNPLTLVFRIDGSLLPAGTTKDNLAIFKNGGPAPISGCTSTAPIDPDPCVSSRVALSGGDIEITVLTSDASTWNFGVAQPGTLIVTKDAAPNDAQNFSFTAGGGLSPTSFQLDDDSDPTLGTTLTFSTLVPKNGYSLSETTPGGWYQARASCNDGSPISNIDIGPGETVTCTFVSSKTYPRPSSATPFRLPLVPSYSQCVSPNSTHVAPLNHPACNPPVLESGILKTSAAGRGSGFVRLRALIGNTATQADEANIQIDASVTDVLRADGTDYPGKVILGLPMRITDRSNGSSGKEAGTVADTRLAVPMDCTTTPGLAGSQCSLSTMADSLVPNFARENTLAVIELLGATVEDAGPDAIVLPPTDPTGRFCPPACGSGDERVFATSGVFTP